MCHTEEVSTALGKAVCSVLSCADGRLLMPLKSRLVVSAWDEMVGPIPVFCINEALWAGLELEDD